MASSLRTDALRPFFPSSWFFSHTFVYLLKSVTARWSPYVRPSYFCQRDLGSNFSVSCSYFYMQWLEMNLRWFCCKNEVRAKPCILNLRMKSTTSRDLSMSLSTSFRASS